MHAFPSTFRRVTLDDLDVSTSFITNHRQLMITCVKKSLLDGTIEIYITMTWRDRSQLPIKTTKIWIGGTHL